MAIRLPVGSNVGNLDTCRNFDGLICRDSYRYPAAAAEILDVTYRVTGTAESVEVCDMALTLRPSERSKGKAAELETGTGLTASMSRPPNRPRRLAAVV